jgi:hypothetical protein
MSEPENQPEPKSDSRPWRKRLARFIVVVTLQVPAMLLLAAFVVLVSWTRSEDFQRRTVNLLESVVEDTSGEEATINEVRVKFWPPAIEVDGFHLYNTITSDTIVSVERARVPVVLRDGGLKIGKLTLQRPRVELHIAKDGKLREFRNKKTPEPGGPKRPLTELPWSSVAVSDGGFRLYFPDGSVAIDHLNLDPTPQGLTDLTAKLRVVYRDLDERSELSLPGITLGPKRIDIPDLKVRTAPLTIEGHVRHPFGEALDVDLNIRSDLEAINPALPPPRKAHGQIEMDLRVEGTLQDPSATVSLVGQGLEAEVPGIFWPIITYRVGDVAAAATATRDGIDLEKLSLYWLDGTLTAWGHITPDLRLENGHVVGDRVSLEHVLKSFDAAPTPWIDMTTDLEIAWAGTLKPLRLEGNFDFLVAELQVGDRPISDPEVQLMLDVPQAYAQGTLVMEKDHILMTAPQVQGPRSRGGMICDIGFGPRGPLDLKVDLHHADLRDFQPLKGVGLTSRGAISGHFWGPFNKIQFEGQGDVTDFSVLDIPYADRMKTRLRSVDMKSIELLDANADKGQSTYVGDFKMDFRPGLRMDTEVRVHDGRIEDIVGIFVDLPGMRGDMDGTLSLHGPLFDIDGAGHFALSNIDLWGEGFETGEAHGYMDAGLFTLDDVRALRNGGNEGILLRGSVKRDWKLDMELMADGLALQRLDVLRDAALPLTGDIAAYAHITNTLFDPSPDGRISITNVAYDGFPIDDSHGVFDSTDGTADYTAVVAGGTAEIQGTLGLWGDQPYALTGQLRKLPAHSLYPTGTDGQPIRALVSGDLDVSGDFGEVWSEVDLSLALDDIDVTYRDHHLKNTTPWTYTQHGRQFSVEEFTLSGGDTTFQVDATSEWGTDLELAGHGIVDLDLLPAFVDGLDRAVGQATVELFATGNQPDVHAEVIVEVDAKLFRYETIPAAFEDMRMQARITHDGIEIPCFDKTGTYTPRMQAAIGGGTLFGCGTIAASDWVPTRYNLKAEVRDAQIQWVETLPPAIGDASLHFEGPVDTLLLSGDVDINEMVFSERIDWEDWIVEYRSEMLVDPTTTYDEDAYFSMDIGITSDGTISLANNVAEGIASAQLRIIGDTARPGLTGEVWTHDATIAFLQDREFRMERGLIKFADPWTWDPNLDFDLRTDIDSYDQLYQVHFFVGGPFSDWRSTARSEPSLPQSDLNSLLWFGITTDDLEERGEFGSAVAQSVADMILTDFLITNAQAGELSSELPDLFDRIDLATGVNGRGVYSSEPRLVVEKRLDELGDIDLTWEFNLVRPEDNYVSADKRIGGIWSLSGWYASLQRDRVLPIGGAYGVDVTARWETD